MQRGQGVMLLLDLFSKASGMLLKGFKQGCDMMPFNFYKDHCGFNVDPSLWVAKAGAGKPVRRNAGESSHWSAGMS